MAAEVMYQVNEKESNAGHAVAVGPNAAVDLSEDAVGLSFDIKIITGKQ